MAFLKINNTSIYYQVQGKGPPLLLIAGLMSDSQSWGPALNRIAKHFQVITFDNRGAGRTTFTDTALTIPKITEDCLALIGHLGLRSVHLLGHSMGGFVALDFALRYPQNLDRLILESASSGNSQRNNMLFGDWTYHRETGIDLKLWFKNIFYWLFSERFFADKNNLEQALRAAVDYPWIQSAAGFRRQTEAIRSFGCAADLRRISAETLILTGQKDLLFPPCRLHRLKPIPKSKVRVVPEAAHALHLEAQNEFTENILEFLR